MKKIIIFILSCFCIIASSSATEENKSPLKYEYYNVKGYRLFSVGSPMLVKLHNLSSQPITIDPVIVTNEIVTYDEVIKKGRILMGLSIGMTLSGEVMLGLILTTVWQSMLARAVIICSTATVAHKTYEWLFTLSKNAEKDWHDRMLREHVLITINPGETVEKIYWIKNTGPVHIEYKIV